MRRLLTPAALLLCATACGRGSSGLSIPLPDFTMTSVAPKSQAPFGRRDLLGRVWIADFIYTRCSGPCPLLTQRLAALGKALPPEIGLLSVSVDPDGDTPERLRAYARDRGLDPRRWVFLRGSIQETYQLLYAGFRLPMSTQPDAPPQARVTHSTRFVLVDQKGAIRGYYEGLVDADADALGRDARRLLEVGS